MNTVENTKLAALDLEDALTLSVSPFTLPEITTNTSEVLSLLKSAMANFTVEKYAGQEDIAKKDRAVLNKMVKLVKDKKAAVRKSWLSPLEQFDENCASIVKELERGVSIADGVVKELERIEDEAKRAKIQRCFDGKNFDLVPLDRLFNAKWLNKTEKMSAVEKEIDRLIAEIYGNIKVLENIPEHAGTLKALYLETLDMGAAMRQLEALKANAEKLAKEKAERERREIEETCAKNQKALRREWGENKREEEIERMANDALDISPDEAAAQAAERENEIIDVTLRFRIKRKLVHTMKQWMTSMGIAYEKIDTPEMRQQNQGENYGV